jgi:hypothetical protein
VPARAALSRELGNFLVELSIALHRHAIYPNDHPSLEPAAAAIARRAALLLADRPTMSLGVARSQLVIEGVATDANHPVLRDLAGRLHRHHLGAVTFRSGLETAELFDVLRTLAVDATRTGQPLGLGPAEQLRRWAHVRLHPVSFDRLEMIEAEAHAADDTAKGLRAAQLWVGLARAALAASRPADEPPPSTEPTAIAQAINTQPRSEGYDQAIVGYLLQIAEELKNAGSAEAAALRRRMSRLISALEPETLRRLLDMGGDLAQRREFALNATQTLALDAVLEIARAAAAASQQTVSHSLLRLLAKLAMHAEEGSEGRRSSADANLREQVRELVAGWTLTDPNPGAYGAALQRLAQATPGVAANRPDGFHDTELERLVGMAIEIGEIRRPVWRAVESLVEDRRLGALAALLEAAPAESSVAALLWERLAAPDVVRRLSGGEPADFQTIDLLLPRLERPALTSLLDTLAASESRGTRRGLLDRLMKMADQLGNEIVARLADPRWYVRRNMLVLLDAMTALPSGFTAASHLTHPDARVRREALKIAVRIPDERERALIAALADSDARVVAIALTIVQQACPAAVVPAVIRVATEPATPSEMRVPAIRVLGAVTAPAARDALLHLVDGGRTFLGRRRLAPKSPEVVGALAGLFAGWRRDPQARALLALAQKSKDPELRLATSPGRDS